MQLLSWRQDHEYWDQSESLERMQQQDEDFDDENNDDDDDQEDDEENNHSRSARGTRHRENKRRGHKKKNKGNYRRRFVNKNGVNFKPFGDAQLFDLSVSSVQCILWQVNNRYCKGLRSLYIIPLSTRGGLELAPLRLREKRLDLSPREVRYFS